MPPKKCSDRAPRNMRETSVSTCYKRGLKSGFVAGLNKEKEKYKTIPVERATNDLRKAFLAELRIPNYRGKSATETIQILRNRGFDNLIIPKVR